MNHKGIVGFAVVIGVIVIIAIIGVFLFIKRSTISQSLSQVSLNYESASYPTSKPTNTNNTPSNESGVQNKSSALENMAIFASSGGNVFIIELINYDRETGSSCKYYLQRKDGFYFATEWISPENNIDCDRSEHYGVFSRSFKGWKGNSTFLLETKQGTVKAFDIEKHKVITEFNYDPNQFTFFEVNKDLSYWLLKKKTEEKEDSHFILVDKSKKPLNDSMSFPPMYGRDSSRDLFDINYDELNNGFLFVSRIYNLSDSTVSISFDYLSLSDFKIKNILTTKFTKFGGRGCGGFTRTSSIKVGEIRYGNDCITVDQSYYAEDGFIHMNL